MDLQKFMKKIRTPVLCGSQKATIRDYLISLTPKVIIAKETRDQASFNIFPKRGFAITAAVIAILGIALTGGTALAVKDTLPNSFFYPIKIYFSEKIRGVTKVSPEDKALWQTQLMNRRLSEAAALAKKNQLNEKAAKQLQDSYLKHREELNKKINELKKQNNAPAAREVTDKVDKVLNNYNKILSDIASKKNTAKEDGSINSILKMIESEMTKSAINPTR